MQDVLTQYTIEKEIKNHVKIGSRIYTDDFLSYSKIGKFYSHKAVKHGQGEYVSKKDKETHTNSIESFWAIFKRGYHGIYHSMSKKHLQRYVDEFTYRFNTRDSLFELAFYNLVNKASSSKQLSYKSLIK